MSRSRRRTPIAGHTLAESDKPWKVLDSRRLRRRNVQNLHIGHEPLDAREIVDPWHWPKDGKGWVRPECRDDAFWRK